MNNQLKNRTRLALLAERIGQSKSFVSITGVVQFLLDVLAWSAAAAFALVLRSYLQDEQRSPTRRDQSLRPSPRGSLRGVGRRDLSAQGLLAV